MYGSIVDEWKRTYRLNRKARVRGALNRAALGMGLVFMIFGGYLSIHHWYVEPRRYRALLREADLQNAAKYKEYESGFTKLRDTLGFGNQAKELWAAAWRRRAHFAASKEKGTRAGGDWTPPEAGPESGSMFAGRRGGSRRWFHPGLNDEAGWKGRARHQNEPAKVLNLEDRQWNCCLVCFQGGRKRIR